MYIRNKNIIALLTLSILLAFSLAFNAAFGIISLYNPMRDRFNDTYERPHTDTDTVRQRIRESWNLTDEQWEDLKMRRERLKSQLTEKRNETREVRERLIALLEDPDSDAEAIAGAAQEYHEEQLAMRQLIFEDLLELREMLDREQRKKLGETLMRRYSAPGAGSGREDGSRRRYMK